MSPIILPVPSKKVSPLRQVLADAPRKRGVLTRLSKYDAPLARGDEFLTTYRLSSVEYPVQVTVTQGK